jgi:hypothetical protein
MAFLYEVLQFAKEEQRVFAHSLCRTMDRLVLFSPASISAGVTYGTYGMYTYKQRVVVAIVLDIHHM